MNAERAQLARRADILLSCHAVDDQVHATNGRQAGHAISVGFGLGDEALEVLERQMDPEVIPEWRHDTPGGEAQRSLTSSGRTSFQSQQVRGRQRRLLFLP